jgi:2Fe-2S ferredoxin
MPSVTFLHPDGRRQEIAADDGSTVMQAATAEGLEEILAECGGNCMCATCHVYVLEDAAGALPPPTPDEDALLDGTAAERRPKCPSGNIPIHLNRL